MQSPDGPHQLRQKSLTLAGILAAAVHHGYLSVQEGICDALDMKLVKGMEKGHTQLPRLIAEQYMNRDKSGKLLAACQLCVTSPAGHA